MSGNDNDNVHPYRREPLEPEVVATSIETTQDEVPLTVVNRDKRRAIVLAALKRLRTRLFIPVLVSAAIEWAIRSSRQHPIAVAAVTTASAGGAIVAAAPYVMIGDQQFMRPPAVIQVVTLSPSPAMTYIVTAPAKPSRTASRPVERSGPMRTRETSASDLEPTRPAASPTAKPTPPSASNPPRPRRSSPSTTDVTAEPRPKPRSEAVTTPSPPNPDSAQDAPTAPPQTAEASPPPPAAKDCTIQVGLDPLLDLCVTL